MRLSHRTLGLTLVALLAAGTMANGQEKILDKITEALPSKAPAEPKAKRKVLIFSRTTGFRHSSIPVGVKAITMMGDKTGAYLAYATEDESIFAPEKLNTFDAVLMLNTTGPNDNKYEPLLPKFDKQDPDSEAKARQREEVLKKSLLDFVSQGKGLMGIHAATDTYKAWKEYNKMMGGAFAGHPWNAKDKVTVKVLQPSHPLCSMFKETDFDIVDEIYQFRLDTALPSDRLFLLSLDTEKMDTSRGNRKQAGPYPISWVSTYGKGRTFYCSLGHNEHIYWNPTILQHYLAGLQYVLGDLNAEAKATEP